MNIYQIVLTCVIAFMSVLSFALMGVDKRKAIAGKRRISEKALFAAAILMGAIGGTLGMLVFRHKTKHWYFAVFFPVLAVLYVLILALGTYYLSFI